MDYFKHETADVSDKAKIGKGTKIWNWCQVRENATIGENCIIGKNAYVDTGAIVGNNVKIQNNASVYDGVTLEDGVFVGPHVCFTNDKIPRAINEDGSLKGGAETGDWEISKILVKRGASIGANSTILPGVTIGEFAMVGAGSVVTRNVPDYTLVLGNPARAYGIVDKSGKIVSKELVDEPASVN
ncbi:MAG: acyltransferase [Patescibacteria group bacterium]|jgi:acetyltransferase-like isoleucine patch superfamily enzyme